MFKWFMFLGLFVSTSVSVPVLASTSALAPSTPAPTSVFQTDETPNYCHDAAKNADWEIAIKRFPNDTVLLRLYALRRGLCAMIDEGRISLDLAIDLFEGGREQGIQERHKKKAPRNGDVISN